MDDADETRDIRDTPAYRSVYDDLLLAARYRGSLTSQEVAALAGLPLSGRQTGRRVNLLLNTIAGDEHRAGRPLLSAIVITGAGKVSDGFFDLARRLGLLAGDDAASEHAFLERERARVYQQWKRPLLTLNRAQDSAPPGAAVAPDEKDEEDGPLDEQGFI